MTTNSKMFKFMLASLLGILLICNCTMADVPDEWLGVINKTFNDTTPVMATVVTEDGSSIDLNNSYIAAFLGDEIRGCVEFKRWDKLNLEFFNLGIGAESTTESGYAFKFYNPATDRIYDLKNPEDNEPLKYNGDGYGKLAVSSEGKTVLEPFVLTLPQYPISVTGGKASTTKAFQGDTVEITADTAPEHTFFNGWESEDGIKFADEKASKTTFAMPAKNVSVTAVFENEPMYEFTVVNGTPTKGQTYKGDTVTVTAEAPEAHKEFTAWTSEDDVVFQEPNSLTTSFTMPERNVTVKAEFADEKKVQYKIVNGSSTGGEEYAGETITITAKAPEAHKVFKKWQSDSINFAAPEQETTTFVLPKTDDIVTVTAVFDDEPMYEYTVVNGTPASGKAYAGDTVTITAIDRSKEHWLFDKWTGDASIADSTKATTTFTMPAKAVTITANYNEEGQYGVTVNGGKADKSTAYRGDTVTITADTTDANKQFVRWTSSDVTMKDA
ncbi:MAG: hypothetical protein J6X55_08045, partial [Victivallales bacterium]|nr:hypothetical protein [Victivallales bacterium]